MKNRNVLGIILVAIGAVLLLQAFDVIQGNIFFNGWWTLFLIVPAIVSMSRTGITVGNGILLVLGVGFFLQEQGWNLDGYLVPAIFIVLGIAILLENNVYFLRKLQQKEGIIYQNECVYVINDAYPVSKGHCLIITKRHIESYFETSHFEIIAIDEALRFMKKTIDDYYHPDGYNIGVNCGNVAGQTVMHLHIHLIPRYENDCKNPQGGVRGVIPEKQKY